jgi:hypothetical protein
MRTAARIRSVILLDGFRTKLGYADGSERAVDLGPHLEGPMFAPILKDAALFRQVRVEPDFGGLEWPNGADICPDLLYHGRRPAAPTAASPASPKA